MITIIIDNKPYRVKQDQNLLHACLSLGFDLPYFCWHPAMHSVGACRQCAVKLFKDEKDMKGRIVMSCMTPVSDGMRLSVDDPDARAFRASVIEWLMLNHPHDCPVCDEGGECHLQDMTVMTGHAHRRTRFPKRTYRNQYLGPLINHEMNRCIQCYRCVRFYRGIAGGKDLNVFSCHDHVYFGRAKDGALENEFSGNLVEICPTGVFTDKTLKKHYTRKWDLQTAPSVCVHCGVGCNTIAGERYGSFRRILNRYNGEVNGYFLCDRGRFGYEFVNSDKRVRSPLLMQGKKQQPAGRDAALKRIDEILSGSRRVIGIGSPRASLESNFALRTLVGSENFYSGMAPQEHGLMKLIIDILERGPARTPSLKDVRAADAVLVLGEDVTNTAPLLALSLRQAARNRQFEIAAKMKIPAWDENSVLHAAQNEKSPLFLAAYSETKLDDIAARTYRAAPDDIAGLGFAIAHEVDSGAPAVTALEPDVLPLAKEIASVLKKASRPLVVSGTGCMSTAVIQAAANIAWALCRAGKPAELCYAVPECNSLGAGLMGGKDLDEAFKVVRDGNADTVIILENDLSRRSHREITDGFLSGAGNVIVIDHLLNPTSSKADVLLPAGTFAESDGILVNHEGRAQKYFQVFVPPGEIRESWKWIDDIMKTVGKPLVGSRLTWDNVINDIASALPAFTPIRDIAPPAGFRIDNRKIPRQPHRYSGRTAILAGIDVHEPKPPEDVDSPFSFSMEGHEGEPPAPVIQRYWAPGWNSAQALNKFQQETGGPLRGGDPGRRLIEPKKDDKTMFFPVAAESDRAATGTSIAHPIYRLFGSEELSSLAPGIIELIPEP